MKITQNLQGGLPRSHSLARNDEILDSSPTAQNDNVKESHNDKNSVRVAESALDSANLLVMTFFLNSTESQNLPYLVG